MQRSTAAALGAFLALNALLMLFIPEPWYRMVPGVDETGPYNPHFVRDIGCAFLVTGFGLLAFARDPLDAWARGAAFAGALFLSLHALTHVWDFATGRESLAHLGTDALLVFLPPALAFWCLRRGAKT